MVTVTFQFHTRLNHFLAREHRDRRFSCLCAQAATTKHMIEALGVPHTEVGAMRVNGTAAGFDRLLADGDLVEIFPFSGMDNEGNCALQAGTMRFVADAHLGGLARLLRMAGFDTLYDNHYADAEIERIARLEDRIVLTRDCELLKRREVGRGCYIRALKAEAQLQEVCERFGLARLARPFTLCLHCNAPLHSIEKQLVLDRLPPSVRTYQNDFSTCHVCKRVFWQGSHWRRMRGMLQDVLASRR